MQHLIGDGYKIKKEYHKSKVEIKGIEAAEQERESKDLEIAYTRVMTIFRDALKELVRAFSICKYVGDIVYL